MRNNAEILVIGAGIIGLCIARELRRRGVGRILVIERGRAGGEASHAAAGMLAPNAECELIDDLYRFCDLSRGMYPAFAEELRNETGIDIQLDRSGTLYAAFTEADLAHLDVRHDRQKAAGIVSERLSAPQTLKAEPALAPAVRGSLYFPDDWQVENRLVLQALLISAAENGIEIVEGTRVDSLIIRNGRVAGAIAGGDRYLADTTVLATGAWTSLIQIAGEPIPLSVKPIRGQMISFQPGERLFNKVVYSPRGYLVPRADGRVLIGATVEDVGFDDRATEEGVATLRSAANEIAPCLGRLEISESWSGLRPFAEGGSPVIGSLPGVEGAYVATAHYRNGILLAPITAKLLAERIVNGRDSHFLRNFGPDRSTSIGFNAAA